jgi:hypothetical protein
MLVDSRTMRLRAAIVAVLLRARSVSAQVVTEPKFQIEIQTSGAGSPKFSITNLLLKTLVACTISYSVSTEARPQGKMNWNPLVRAGHDPQGDAQGPLEPSRTLTLNLPHVAGGPLPNKVEIIAGIWADGETFGQAFWIKSLIDTNASMVSVYEKAIALLQEGIEHNWTREQYLAALNGKTDSLPFYSIRQTFLANEGLDQHPQLAKTVAQHLLDHFEQDLQLLRPQKSRPKPDSASSYS